MYPHTNGWFCYGRSCEIQGIPPSWCTSEGTLNPGPRPLNLFFWPITKSSGPGLVWWPFPASLSISERLGLGPGTGLRPLVCLLGNIVGNGVGLEFRDAFTQPICNHPFLHILNLVSTARSDPKALRNRKTVNSQECFKALDRLKVNVNFFHNPNMIFEETQISYNWPRTLLK